MKSPPFLPTWLLKRWGCSANNEAVLGDLAERYQTVESDRWYWRQILTTIVVSVFQDLRSRKLLALRAFLGAALVGSCAELFLLRNIGSLYNLVPSDWWSSEAFFKCFETLVWMPAAFLAGFLFGWPAVRLYRRGKAVLLLYIAVSQIFFVMRLVAGFWPPYALMSGFYLVQTIVHYLCFVLGVVAGGRLAGIPSPGANPQKGNLP